MVHEKFIGVTFNDLDPSGTRISRSSEISVVNSSEMANIPHKRIFYESETTDKIIYFMLEIRKLDNSKIRKALFVNLYVTDMRYSE